MRDITLAVVHPLVNRIARSRRQQIPVTRIVATRNEFRGTSVAQRESGSVRIDTCKPTITDRQTNAAFFRHIDAIQAVLLDRQSCPWRVEFEKLATAIELRNANYDCTFDDTQRYAFISQ